MSFSAIVPGGWSSGAKIVSANVNQLQANMLSTLDKSTAGDTIAGTILFTGAGCIECQAADDIYSAAAAGITSQVAGGIQSQTAGGIELNGGANDEIVYGTPRTKVRAWGCLALNDTLGAGWTTSSAAVIGPATGTTQGLSFGPLPHNGATLTNVRIYVKVGGPHSALPAIMPGLQIYQHSLATGINTLLAGPASPSAASYSAWDTTTYWDCPVDAVIDTTQYEYHAILSDENGANSVAGNVYTGLVLTFSDITSGAFA